MNSPGCPSKRGRSAANGAIISGFGSLIYKSALANDADNMRLVHHQLRMFPLLPLFTVVETVFQASSGFARISVRLPHGKSDSCAKRVVRSGAADQQCDTAFGGPVFYTLSSKDLKGNRSGRSHKANSCQRPCGEDAAKRVRQSAGSLQSAQARI
ncbi:unnamed protein product [Symbiodinium natans]|uniref:Uncharacterized protein n=1 Tax=Symbiodinium natans TaxID=878477 RepID=A0A812QNX7_9DINO|nr:unnamed protein product [Symbiodinium natans]